MDGINIRNENDLDDLIEYISCMILGVANDEEILPYHQKVRTAEVMLRNIFSDLYQLVKQKQVVQKHLDEIGREILSTAKSDKDGNLRNNWPMERVEYGKHS